MSGSVRFGNVGGDPFQQYDDLEDFCERLEGEGADRVLLRDEEWRDASGHHDRPVVVEGLDAGTAREVYEEYQDSVLALSPPSPVEDTKATSVTYVDDPSDAPGGVEVYEDAQGRHYYVADGPDGWVGDPDQDFEVPVRPPEGGPTAGGERDEEGRWVGDDPEDLRVMAEPGGPPEGAPEWVYSETDRGADRWVSLDPAKHDVYVEPADTAAAALVEAPRPLLVAALRDEVGPHAAEAVEGEGLTDAELTELLLRRATPTERFRMATIAGRGERPEADAKAEWSYEEGPRGGDRWVSGDGDVRYQKPAGADEAPKDDDAESGIPQELAEAEAESRGAIDDLIDEHAEPYEDREPAEGDRVVDATLDPPDDWSARAGTVTAVKEGTTGTSVDVEFDDGSSLEWAGQGRFGALDGGRPDDDGDEGDGRPPVAEAVADIGSSDDPADVADAIGVDPSNRTEFRELADEEQFRLEEGLKEVYGEREVSEIYDMIDEWKAWSDGDAGHFLETGFSQTGDGLWGESFRDGGAEPSYEQVQALDVMRQVSQDFVREEYGEEVEVHRGISEQAWDQYDEDDDYPVEMSSMAVMSTEEDTAESFAHENDSATITMTVPPDEVVFAMDATTDAVTNGGREGELQIMGGPRSPDEVDPA